MPDLTQQRILLTGGRGFLGQAIRRGLRARGVAHEMIATPSSLDCDLRDPSQCRYLLNDVFGTSERGVIIHAAAVAGGVGFHRDHPTSALIDNSLMALGLVRGLVDAGLVDRGIRVVGVGSMCAYPSEATLPISEDQLWNGYPAQPTAPYGIAKRLLWQSLDAAHREFGLESSYVVLSNLYGPGAEFDPTRSNVVAAMIDRFLSAVDEKAQSVTCWGTGSPKRDFLFVDDAAEGVIRAAERITSPDPINLGAGEAISIKQLAEVVASHAGYRGAIEWDTGKPDGAPLVLADVTRATKQLGWKAQFSFDTGLRRTIDWRRAERSRLKCET